MISIFKRKEGIETPSLTKEVCTDLLLLPITIDRRVLEQGRIRDDTLVQLLDICLLVATGESCETYIPDLSELARQFKKQHGNEATLRCNVNVFQLLVTPLDKNYITIFLSLRILGTDIKEYTVPIHRVVTVIDEALTGVKPTKLYPVGLPTRMSYDIIEHICSLLNLTSVGMSSANNHKQVVQVATTNDPKITMSRFKGYIQKVLK